MLDFALARATGALWKSSRAWLDAALFRAPVFGTLRGYFFKD